MEKQEEISIEEAVEQEVLSVTPDEEASDAPHTQTSLRWNWLENSVEKFDNLPLKLTASLGPQGSSFLGLLGLCVTIFLSYSLILKPLHKQPFGSPYVYTAKMAKHFVPGSRLGRAKIVRRSGLMGMVKYTALYTAAYTTGYLTPYFFSAKLKRPDLLMFMLRGLFLGLLSLFSVKLFFTKEPEVLPTPS